MIEFPDISPVIFAFDIAGISLEIDGTHWPILSDFNSGFSDEIFKTHYGFTEPR